MVGAEGSGFRVGMKTIPGEIATLRYDGRVGFGGSPKL